MSAAGRGMERSDLDFYETPPWPVHELVARESLGLTVLDAGAGTGAIAREVLGTSPGTEVCAIEKDSARARACAARLGNVAVLEADFLTIDPYEVFRLFGDRWPDSVVKNSPFTWAAEFTRKALECVRPDGKVCSLLPLSFLGSSSKRWDLVRGDGPLERVRPLGKRVSFCVVGRCHGCDLRVRLSPKAPRVMPCTCSRKGRGKKKVSWSTTDASEYGWFTFRRGYTGPTILDPIPAPADVEQTEDLVGGDVEQADVEWEGALADACVELGVDTSRMVAALRARMGGLR